MKKSFIISLLIITALLTSCDGLEQTVDSDLPYVEKLIIQGQFSIYDRNLSVSVTKTIPPLEDVTLEKVTITDAECKVYYKDKVINLIHQGESIYVSKDTLTIEGGVEYRLEVNWKDKFAVAKSTIPRNPELVSIIRKNDKGIRNNYEFTFISKDKGIIGFSNYRMNLFEKSQTKYVILTNDVIDFSQKGELFTYKFFDIQYYSYYQTRNKGESDGGIFNNGGLNMEGNVKGEDVFGTWYGYNVLGDYIDSYLNK